MSLPVWLLGPKFLLGGLCPGPMFLPGRSLSTGGLCPGEGDFCPGVSVALPPTPESKSKWHAYHWNVFLLFNVPTGFQTSSNK